MMLLLLSETLFAQNQVILTVQHQTPIADSETSLNTPLIQVRFDDPEAKLQIEKLLIEVDRNDVTSIAQFSDSTLTYQPAAPLQTGTHEIKINGTLKDGTAFQEVKWSFKVTDPEVPRNLSLEIQPTISFEQALYLDAPGKENETLLSNITFNSRTSGPVTSSLISTFQGQDQIVAGRTRFDLATLQASFNTRTTNLFLGDVVLNQDQLGINNLARRGILFQQGLPLLKSSFDVFSVRSETIFGFRHGLGISNSEQRVDGGSFFFSPTRNESLGLRLYYLRGENALAQGFNFGGVTLGEKGNAYGLNLTSLLFQGKIRAEAFSGWSDFDLNSTDEIEGNPDRGFLARISYTPNPFTFRSRPSSFILQSEIQDIGLFYRSLGNPFLVADRRGLNLTSTWTVGAISMIGGASRFHDNVKNSPLLAKVNNTGYTAGFAITPIPTGTSFTLPSFALNYTRTEQDSENEPVAFMGIKNRINNFASVLSWNVNRLNLGLNANHSMNRDENNRVPDTNVTQATLALSYISSAAMNFGPSIAYTRQSDLDSGINQQLWTYSLTSTLPLFRPDFILNNQISLSTVDSSNLLSQSSNFSGTAQLLWNLNQTWQNQGTQTLSLRISYNRNLIEAPFFTLTKGLEVFAAISFGWPILNTWEGK